MGGDVQTVWDHLGIEHDEAVVLSAVYEWRGGDQDLMAASLLAGPAAITEGWPSWRLAEGFKPRPSDDVLRLAPTFVTTFDGGMAGRAILTQQEAYRWLRSALESGVCPAIGDLPEARASLGRARAPIRISTHSETVAGDLATWLARPILGFHFPRAEEAIGLLPGGRWTVGDVELFSPGIDALGISWFEEKKGAPPSGLLFGRFERQAWLVSQRLDTEHDFYRVEIGVEPDRVELMDLEIEVAEQIGDELVFAEHLRLEDIFLGEAEDALYGPPPGEGRLELGVELPTLGRGVKRSVRLTHRDGMLLDEWLSFNIFESVSVNLTVDGAEQTSLVTGEKRGPQDLVALLGAVERIRSQYADLRRSGARNRVFEEVADGMAALRSLLRRARGELLVVDPFFKDWTLLEGLSGPPPRVLIGEAANAPPIGFDGKVRCWSKNLTPFHDRFFLWEGGGVSVGTSAGSLHDRLFRIVRIGAAEATVLRERFALWWDDPGFVPLP